MIARTKKYLFVFEVIVVMLSPAFVQGQQIKLDTGKLQLANQYYRDFDFEKASVLYKEIFDSSGSQYYFNLYLNCLLELNDFELAEQEIKKQLRRTKDDAGLYVQWGYLLKRQNQPGAGIEKYDRALKTIQNNGVLL